MSEPSVLFCRLLIVASDAKGLMVVRVPEQFVIASVRYDMIGNSSSTQYSVSFAVYT